MIGMAFVCDTRNNVPTNLNFKNLNLTHHLNPNPEGCGEIMSKIMTKREDLGEASPL